MVKNIKWERSNESLLMIKVDNNPVRLATDVEQRLIHGLEDFIMKADRESRCLECKAEKILAHFGGCSLLGGKI